MGLFFLLLTPVFFAISLRIRNRWIFPFLCALPAYAGYVSEVQHSIMNAFLVLVVWTILQSALVLRQVLREPEKMKETIWRAPEYAGSMFTWIRSGILPEGGPFRVVLFHLKQAALYCAMALATGNFFSLILGCALLNYMNFYVAQLVLHSERGSIAWAMGWNPWSVVRVLSFLWLGSVLGLPLLSLILSFPDMLTLALVAPGFAGIAADIIFKISLSQIWSELLRRNLK